MGSSEVPNGFGVCGPPYSTGCWSPPPDNGPRDWREGCGRGCGHHPAAVHTLSLQSTHDSNLHSSLSLPFTSSPIRMR